MTLFNSSIFSHILRSGVMFLGLICATGATAQSSADLIAERLKPVGEVCVAGDPCAGGTAAPAAAASGEFVAENAYQQNCSVCHASGMAGAPKLGDSDEWAKRIADKGMDGLVSNAINGINAMPARGMCMTCSDENIAELVDYLTAQ
ncbi:MAG: c-type cytochrome [Pseudohongiellaceae bacterium]|nr:c-type cytochrome [Pseudohongiellaceae bacterium]